MEHSVINVICPPNPSCLGSGSTAEEEARVNVSAREYVAHQEKMSFK